MARSRALDDEARKAVARRYTQGETLANLAEDLGVNPSTIRNTLSDEGVTLRPRGRRPSTASA